MKQGGGHVLWFSVRSNQEKGVELCVLPSSTLLSKYDYFWIQSYMMTMAIIPNSMLQSGYKQLVQVMVGLNLVVGMT